MKTLIHYTITPAILSGVLSILAGACPPWESEAGDGHCKCGNSLKGVVHCNSHTQQLLVQDFHCMTYNTRSNKTTVGKCLNKRSGRTLSCSFYTVIETKDMSHLNTEVCGCFNRTGQL